MKLNKIFFILAFGLLYGTMCGQTGTLYRVPFSGVDNIVRYEPVTGRHVTYSLVAGNENHFSLTDLNTLIDVRVAVGLKVRDFEILDEQVFFCGENGSGSGFLGWFNINDLFYNGAAAHIDQTLSTLGLLTLDNIEVFRNPVTDKIHVVGYGVHSHMSLYKDYRAFEAVGFPLMNMSYRTMDLRSTWEYGDYSDIVVTDNFVVYLSSIRSNAIYAPFGPIVGSNIGVGIDLQPFPKYDMFGNPPFYYHYYQLAYISSIFASGWVLPINNDPYSSIEPKMVHSDGDKIAVCTYRQDLDDNSGLPFTSYFPPTATYITHMEFDLSTLLPSTNNFIPMTSYRIAQLYLGKPISLDGFEYDPQTKRYAILHRHESSSGVYEHAVTIFDFIGGMPTSVESSYQTAFNTISGWRPENMCFDGTVYYTVMGHDMMSSEFIFWRKNISATGGQYSNCERNVQYPVTPLPLVPAKYYENAALPTVWKPLVFQEQERGDVQEFFCELMCNMIRRKE